MNVDDDVILKDGSKGIVVGLGKRNLVSVLLPDLTVVEVKQSEVVKVIRYESKKN